MASIDLSSLTNGSGIDTDYLRRLYGGVTAPASSPGGSATFNEQGPSYGADTRSTSDPLSSNFQDHYDPNSGGGVAGLPPGTTSVANSNTSSPSAIINAANPTADASKPYVQAGNTGGYIDGIGVTIGPGSSLTPAQAKAYYDAGVAKFGQAAVDDFLARNKSPAGVPDYARIDSGLSSQTTNSGPDAQGVFNNGAPQSATNPGGYLSADAVRAGATNGSPTAGTGPYSFSGGQVPTSGFSQFTDPITAALMQVAQSRADQLTNPAPNSGQSLLENALATLAQSFQSGGYTPAEQQVFQTQAFEPIEQMRAAQKQNVTQQLAQRGIPLSSGIAQQMLANVDQQFDALRTQAQTGIASQEAQNVTNRQLQTIQLLQALAGTQGARLDQAFNYQSVPYNAAQQSFQNAATLVNQNNPASLVNPLLSLYNVQANQQYSQGQALANLVAQLFGQGGVLA